MILDQKYVYPYTDQTTRRTNAFNEAKPSNTL